MTTRLRIAVYYNTGWGGGRRWLYECISRLARYHDVDLFTIDRNSIGVQHPDVSELGLPIDAEPFADLPRWPGVLRPLDAPLLFADLWRFDRVSKNVAARIDAGGYDVLFASIGGYSEAPLVLRHSQTKSAYYCHEPMRSVYETPVPRDYARHPLKALPRALWNRVYWRGLVRAWDRDGTRRAGLVIANSRYTADYAKRAYGVESIVNYPGVDCDAFRPGAEPRERFVVTVGELIATKGFDWAVRAIGSVPSNKRPPLVLVCNRVFAPERAYVERVARRHSVDLRIRERVADAEVKRLLRTATAGLFTPHLEPLGLAILETMASGTPVVAVREAGPIETVVDGGTGFLCDREPDALARRITQLLDDPHLVEGLGSSARAHVVAHWGWDDTVGELSAAMSAFARGERVAGGLPHPFSVTT